MKKLLSLFARQPTPHERWYAAREYKLPVGCKIIAQKRLYRQTAELMNIEIAGRMQ